MKTTEGTDYTYGVYKVKRNLSEFKKNASKIKAIAHPMRLKLLAELMNKECCVGEIQNCLAISQPNASQHLKILKDAAIVEGRRDKNRICYRIKDASIIKVLQSLFEN